MLKTNLHIMDECAPNSWANRIEVPDASHIPRIGETIVFEMDGTVYKVRVTDVEHRISTVQGCDRVLVYTQRI